MYISFLGDELQRSMEMAKDNTEQKKQVTIEELKQILKTERPTPWEDIPDIDLYMDQILSYMLRQHIGLDFGETLTSAMINNYMKKDVLPRAKGKRYERTHIAYLTAICLLKQVLSVDSTKDMLYAHLGEAGSGNEASIKAFYEKYCDKLSETYDEVSEKLEDDMSKNDIMELALELAISSYAQKLVCERLLDIAKEKM